jgi:carboxyl-terminal processing protease
MKKILYLSKLSVCLIVLLAFFVPVMAEDSNSTPQQPPVVPSILSADDAIAEAAKDISSGEFELAKKQLDGIADSNLPQAKSLRGIIDQYNSIEAQRDKKRAELYDKQLAEIASLEKKADANGMEDVNDVTAILLAAIKAQDYAQESQKASILEKDIIKKAIDKSVEKAVQYEEKGEWIESILTCYGFLVALDEENKQWKEHLDDLTEKAIIKASLADNPCEKSVDRHNGIKKEMFIRAIMALDYNYVTVITYKDLAVKALKRCKDLAVVLNKMTPNESVSFKNDPNSINAWFSGIDNLSAEVQKPLTGISRDKFIDVFEKVLDLNEKTITVSKEVLIAQFAEASLSELDPHTNLVWPWYVQDFEKMMKSEFSGVGIEISKADGPLAVNSLMPDTPSYNSGIDAGDIIEAVDGESTKDMTIECAVRKITGPEGTKVVLTVRNPKEEKSRDIKITRAKIKVPTIRSWRRGDDGQWLNMIDPNEKIGYIKITSFTSEETGSDFEKQLNDLEKNGMKGLIVDLRFNSGGYLNQAVEIVDKFVNEGLIVSTRPRLGAFPQWEVATGKAHPNYPLVVLINGQSASASEIVAGALQDKAYKRATIVGSRSYGKGSVQTIIGYPGDGAQIKYTMAHYHLPSGQRVKNHYEEEKLGKEDWGIAPDVKVELRSDEVLELYNIQRDNAVVAKEGHDNNGEPVKRFSIDETIKSDPQLAIAVLVTKAKIIEQQAVQQKLAKLPQKN